MAEAVLQGSCIPRPGYHPTAEEINAMVQAMSRTEVCITGPKNYKFANTKGIKQGTPKLASDLFANPGK